MFTVIFHDEAEAEAEAELLALPAPVRAKMVRLLKKLEANPRLLREADTKPLGNDIARGLWVYQVGERIFLLRIFIKKSQKTPRSEIELAFHRLEEMNDEI